MAEPIWLCSRPSSRSVALPTVETSAIENFRYVSRYQPALSFFTWSSPDVPKFVPE